MGRKEEWALALLDEATDLAICTDYTERIGRLEAEYEMTLDEAFQILKDFLKKER